MASFQQHYESHLGPIYLWMVGGLEHALALGATEIAPVLDRPGSPRAGHAEAQPPDGRVLVASGEDSDGNPVPSALINKLP